jgi:hypothetical protein
MSVIPFDTVRGSVAYAPKPGSFLRRLSRGFDALAVRRDHARSDRDGPCVAAQAAPESHPQTSTIDRNIKETLELSELRTYDSALEILGAYKLTGNFPVDLRIVLKDLGVLDKITYDIETKSSLSDSRHVVFRPNNNVHRDRFDEITRSIKNRIGFDATLPWWVRLFR